MLAALLLLLITASAAEAASSQNIIIYATGSKIVRRVIIPDSDAQISVHQPLAGESRLLIAAGQPLDPASVSAAIATATGVTPPSGRTCVIDGTGLVIAVTQADPALDSAPAGDSLVASDLAGPGDAFVGGQFLHTYAVVDSTTNTVTAIQQLALINPAVPINSYLISPVGSLQVGSVLQPHAVGVQTPQ